MTLSKENPSFTDKDLEEMKMRLDPFGVEAIVGYPIKEWRALLNRLEAAEAWGYHGLCQCEIKNVLDCEYWQSWRKRAGK